MGYNEREILKEMEVHMCDQAGQPSPIQVGFSNEMFYAGTHMCLVFRDEDERRAIVSKYVESGLFSGEKVGYFADTPTTSDVADWLASLDVDISEALENDSFSVQEAEQVYCPDGSFSPERMLNKLKDAYNSSVEEGYPNTRVTGEMSWALKGMPGADRLIEYESKVNDVVLTYPVTAMCQYDANKFSGSLIYQALQVHPYMIVNGQLVENPYYQHID